MIPDATAVPTTICIAVLVFIVGALLVSLWEGTTEEDDQ